MQSYFLLKCIRCHQIIAEFPNSIPIGSSPAQALNDPHMLTHKKSEVNYRAIQAVHTTSSAEKTLFKLVTYLESKTAGEIYLEIISEILLRRQLISASGPCPCQLRKYDLSLRPLIFLIVEIALLGLMALGTLVDITQTKAFVRLLRLIQAWCWTISCSSLSNDYPRAIPTIHSS